jgi:carboxypeptidase Taq
VIGIIPVIDTRLEATMSHKVFERLCNYTRETSLLNSIGEVLQWDERVMAPPAAGAYRAEQIAYLAGLVHQRQTDAKVGDWLDELSVSDLADDAESDAGVTIRQLKREYDKQVKLPRELVEALTRAAVLGQQRWVEARKRDDFRAFAPCLEEIIKLKREQAEAIGYQDCLYDALLDDFEPREKTARVAQVLRDLRQQLVPLIGAIRDSGQQPDLEILSRSYPLAAQEQFAKRAATAIGFDFERGRLDVTHHPFCTNLGPHDTRITTRYDEHFFPMAFFGVLHEAGHGLYDQGLRRDQFGLPPGNYISMAIHESQSRLWENLVGRSDAFWQHFFPAAQTAFPNALQQTKREAFVFALNAVRPSLIRVEADEITYNLHIIIRFELEQALLDGQLTVTDLPLAWREKYQNDLGIAPPNDADGVLQDIHWSAALLGYFPTYSLGNLYAAQFYEQADRDLGGIDALLAQGEFAPLLGWFREQVHQVGQRYSAAELVQRVTGQPLHVEPLVRQIRRRFAPLYGLSE